MNKLQKLLLATLLASTLEAVNASAASICIDGQYLVSGEQRQISIFDNVCGQNRGNFTMVGGQKTYGITVCLSGSGYANVTYRNVTNNSSPVTSSFLHDGDCISP